MFTLGGAALIAFARLLSGTRYSHGEGQRG